MYRTTILEKEILIKLSTKLRKEVPDPLPIYESVLSVAKHVIVREKQTSFAVMHNMLGLIIGEVHRGEVIVFSVDHVVEKQNIFEQSIFQRFEGLDRIARLEG